MFREVVVVNRTVLKVTFVLSVLVCVRSNEGVVKLMVEIMDPVLMVTPVGEKSVLKIGQAPMIIKSSRNKSSKLRRRRR